jgi:hypothetical protein
MFSAVANLSLSTTGTQLGPEMLNPSMFFPGKSGNGSPVLALENRFYKVLAGNTRYGR